ncbi:hypothetical protein [Algicola sagamiensis]|uniref:hypothetical protein n=1 Tax=Algicola sagamiensis TaxID=163869 RepID=UPI00037124DB|nr:hypothetical protein [Algicola sagamiensis]
MNINFEDLISRENPAELLSASIKQVATSMKVCDNDAKKMIASFYKYPSWFKFKNHFDASVRHHIWASTLLEDIRLVKLMMKKVGYCKSLMSPRLISLMNSDVKQVKRHKINVIEELAKNAKSGYEIQESLLSDEIDIESEIRMIEYWRSSMEVIVQPSLSDQIVKFTSYQLESNFISRSMDLLDHQSLLHSYIQLNGSTLCISEIARARDLFVKPQVQNFLIQNNLLFERVFVNVIERLKNTSVSELELIINGYCFEDLYRKLILETKLRGFEHEIIGNPDNPVSQLDDSVNPYMFRFKV